MITYYTITLYVAPNLLLLLLSALYNLPYIVCMIYTSYKSSYHHHHLDLYHHRIIINRIMPQFINRFWMSPCLLSLELYVFILCTIYHIGYQYYIYTSYDMIHYIYYIIFYQLHLLLLLPISLKYNYIS